MPDFKATIVTKETGEEDTVFQMAPTMTAAIEAIQRNGSYAVIAISEET